MVISFRTKIQIRKERYLSRLLRFNSHPETFLEMPIKTLRISVAKQGDEISIFVAGIDPKDAEVRAEIDSSVIEILGTAMEEMQDLSETGKTCYL